MGFFDFLKGSSSNVIELPDSIWLTSEAKFRGIARSLKEQLAGRDRPDAALLVAHFADCLAELRHIVDEGSFPVPVVAAGAEALQGPMLSQLALDQSQTILIVAGERHPHPEHDLALLEFARSLPCRCRLVRHLSLADPLLRMFGGQWTENMLKRLGMSEDEAIESGLVARRIKTAQAKLAAGCTSDYPADSAQAWLERNCPNMTPK